MPGAEAYSSAAPHSSVGVLCVHGLTGTPQGVRPVAEHLAAAGYGVSAPRLPGHGTSWQAMALTRYEDWFAVVEAEAVLLRRRHSRLVAFGMSLGGALVTDLAVRRPDLVDALVLVNPAFAATDPRLRLLPLLSRMLPTLPGLADDIRRPGPPRELAYPVLPLRAFASFVAHWPALVASLGSVTAPVLLFRSAHDAVVPALSSDVFLAGVGSADVRTVALAESAHVATLDAEAQTVLDQTERFVSEVAGGGTT